MRNAIVFSLHLVFGGMLMSTACRLAGAADLLEIYRLAQANDPTFEAARYTLESAKQRLPQARAGLLPVIAINGNNIRTHYSAAYDNAPPLGRDVRTWVWMLQLTQPLVRMQNVFAYRESEALVEQAMAQFSQAEQDLILQVSRSYFDVVIAEEDIAVADAQVRAMDEQLSVAKRGFEVGTSTITDVHEAKASVNLARAQQIASVNGLEIRRSELGKIIGRIPGPLSQLRPSVVAPRPEPDNLQTWTDQARKNHPIVRAQLAALSATELAIGKNRAEYLPVLDITASYNGNDSSGNINSPVNYSTSSESKIIGVQFSMPIFSGGAVSARVAEAVAIHYKTQAALEAARRQADADVRQAYAGITNGLAQIEALYLSVEASKLAVKGNQVGYRLGIRINGDVLNAEQKLYASQRDITKVRYDTLFQGLKLKAAAGLLSESDLATINTLLIQPNTREYLGES